MARDLRVLVLTKRQYTNKDLLDDHFGRLRELPLAVARQGHEVNGLCLSYLPKGAQSLRDGPVHWQSLDSGALRLPGLLSFARQARKLAANANVIWACSDAIYAILARRISRQTGVPYVVDLYDNFESFASCRIPGIKMLFRRAVRDASHVTCVSAPLKRFVFEHYGVQQATVLENGYRTDLFKPLDKAACRKTLELPLEARIVGVAGAIHSNRGIEDLFRAFEILSASDPAVNLAFCGARESGLRLPSGTRVHDLGEIPLEDVPAFLNALDVTVICNRDNAFGRYCFPQKAREIMACGVPAVATHVGVMAELFAACPERLYPSGKPQALAAAISSLWNAPRQPPAELPTWDDLGRILESVLVDAAKRN